MQMDAIQEAAIRSTQQSRRNCAGGRLEIEMTDRSAYRKHYRDLPVSLLVSEEQNYVEMKCFVTGEQPTRSRSTRTRS